MKYTLGFLLSAAIGLTAWGQNKQYPLLELNAQAPLADRAMVDVTGQSYSLNDLKKANGLLVIFSANTCPFVLGWEGEYPMLGQIGERNNIGVVLVNSNEALRAGDDSPQAMKDKFAAQGYNTPYVIDAGSALANAFGASTTPHVFLFDKNMRLVYTGAINDKFENKERKVTKYYLNEAMVQLAAGQAIALPQTKSVGCSIKRASN
jgi:hypothetical protein